MVLVSLAWHSLVKPTAFRYFQEQSYHYVITLSLWAAPTSVITSQACNASSTVPSALHMLYTPWIPKEYEDMTCGI